MKFIKVPFSGLKLETWLTLYPECVLLILITLCLVVFWVTIPLPRVDHQLIGSDGIGYYSYLPSVLLDGDLNFSNEFSHFYAFSPEILVQIQQTEGEVRNGWGIGPAMLWAPFFLFSHGLMVILNLVGFTTPADGYGYFYQTVVLSGSILYGGAGLYLTFLFTKEFTANRPALLAAILVVFAGNMVYYLIAEPSMSHTLSLFASGLFFVSWFRRRNNPGVVSAILLGSLGGLMALIRPQDGLFLILPFLGYLVDVYQHQSWSAWFGWLRDGLIAIVCALLVFSPQLVVWYLQNGVFWQSGYENQSFYWMTPKLGSVLFSAHRGLFVWHPVFLIAIIGLLIAAQRYRKFAWLGLLGVVMQWYLIASWHSWFQGESFGGRMFIVCTPIFALGLAMAIEHSVWHRSWTLVYIVGMLLLMWNFLLFVEYRFDLVTAMRVPTWFDITVRRFVFPFELAQRFLR